MTVLYLTNLKKEHLNINRYLFISATLSLLLYFILNANNIQFGRVYLKSTHLNISKDNNLENQLGNQYGDVYQKFYEVFTGFELRNSFIEIYPEEKTYKNSYIAIFLRSN